MERNVKQISLINLLAALAAGVAGFVLARHTGTLAGQTGLVFFGFAFLVMAVSFFQTGLEGRERLERLEFEELNKSRGGSSLFTSTDAEAFPAARAREQFERVFAPGFTILLFLLQAGAAWWLWRWLGGAAPASLRQPTVALALFGLFALVLFLLGKYSGGIARLGGNRLLRPGASYLLLCAYLCFAVAGCVAAVLMGLGKVDLYAARALAAIVALAALENFINLVLEIHRPRFKGAAARLLYESRLIGLLSQPEGIVTTAAQALDYQFGFKVSETWFYRFLERALAWLILLQVGILFLSTSLVFIGAGQQGLIERFGAPLGREPLGPGLHLKLPWPIDTVYHYRTEQVQSFNIGFEPDPQKEKEKTVLWSVSHYKTEFNLLVASRQQNAPGVAPAPATDQGAPADLLSVSIPVQYQIKDVQAYAYKHTDAGKLLEEIGTREVIRYFVGVDLFDVMSSGRAQAAQDLLARIQAQADARELGVRILFVGLQDVHPPVKVAKSFEEVVAASQENEARLRAAEGYALKTVTLAGAEAQKRLRDAEAYAFRTVAAAQAQAGQFANQVRAYRASPQVFTQRAYLQALERGATNSRKYFLASTNASDVLLFNFEDKIRADMLDLTVPGKR